MIRSLFTAASGMNGQQFFIDVIANNLANVNTNGFKKVRVDFQDLLYQTIRPAGSSTDQNTRVPSGIQVGHGSRVADTQRIYTQGNFRLTENPLDLVIEGDGFFRLQLADGTDVYTRDGSFTLDENGQLVNSDGYLVQPNITIPEDATEIAVGRDGTVSVKVAGQTDSQDVGQILLTDFINPAGLKAIGQNLFTETTASGPPIESTPGQEGLGEISSGFLESSNVSVVEELVQLIIGQRAYEVNAKVVQTSDEMLQTANNVKQ
ncbi:MAG: flagellar basal-body rod protein FlgG [Candidatus Omnitrophica bacterium]|nr:Flagellar basal-body rod protein FlgG [bacterium]NUN96937.1 flagellar basal-body rod protein FlgG [Candidatus Omnitrophota bacterium]